MKDANSAVEGLEAALQTLPWAVENTATSGGAGTQVSFRNTAQTKGLQGTREYPQSRALSTGCSSSSDNSCHLALAASQCWKPQVPAVFLETLSVYAFNSLPISDEQYILQPPFQITIMKNLPVQNENGAERFLSSTICGLLYERLFLILGTQKN